MFNCWKDENKIKIGRGETTFKKLLVQSYLGPKMQNVFAVIRGTG